MCPLCLLPASLPKGGQEEGADRPPLPLLQPSWNPKAASAGQQLLSPLKAPPSRGQAARKVRKTHPAGGVGWQISLSLNVSANTRLI